MAEDSNNPGDNLPEEKKGETGGPPPPGDQPPAANPPAEIFQDEDDFLTADHVRLSIKLLSLASVS